MNKIKIDILPNEYLKDDGIFDKEKAFNICGKIAGVCYDKEGFNHLKDEDEKKTNRRINMTLNNGHHSVYDHIFINFNMHNIPKILAMIINNEKQYTTSEKSARYTKIGGTKSMVSNTELFLYNKWVNIFNKVIKKEYGDVFSNSKIEKLAQENARYLVSVFMPTEMIYTTSLRQINYIASWMEEFILNHNANNEFEVKLSFYMNQFINELIRNNVLDDRLMQNDKKRKFSLFGENIKVKQEYFGDIYTTNYKGTFAQLAQAQRHRTINYQMEFLNKKEYFIPPIIENDSLLVEEWLCDINSVGSLNPQGEMILINENGTYDDFILKCKERLCSCAQLEINNQTKETLINYRNYLKTINNPLYNDICKYDKGARCTFPDYTCSSDCNFKEGKVLKRKI